MTTSVTAATARNPAVGSGSVGAIWVDSSTDRARANAPLTGAGIVRELNGGAISTKPVARAVPSRSAASVTAGTERSIAASGPVEQRRQLIEQALGEADQLGEHPVARDQQRDRDGDDLRDEGEGLLLDLGRRLEQRDEEADQQSGQQHGSGHLGSDHHGLCRDLGDVCIRHQPLPPYEPTRAVVISAQPSTTTKSSSLKGSDTMVGGTIIMPIAMSEALTSMSSTRNGMKTTSPMMKALLSSERTNAGINVVMLTWVGVGRSLLPGQADHQLELVLAGVVEEELPQRHDAGVVGLRDGHGPVHVGLDGEFVDVGEDRTHHEQGQEQRDAGEHLVGR